MSLDAQTRQAIEKLVAARAPCRRLEEELCRVGQDLRWSTARSQAILRGTGVTVAAARPRQRQVIEAAGIILPTIAAQVVRWRQHANDHIRAHGLDVRWVALPNTNAYAFQSLRRMEAAPIVSPESYATFLHEAGHLA